MCPTFSRGEIIPLPGDTGAVIPQAAMVCGSQCFPPTPALYMAKPNGKGRGEFRNGRFEPSF